MVQQISRIEEYPDLVTVGMEGNISTYFGLLAAGKFLEARRLGDAIYSYGWDAEQQRMKIGAGPFDYGTSMDTAGSWGVGFLRSISKEADALSSQAYAATVLRTTSFNTDNPAGTFVEGYGDIAGPWTMTVEFGAQAAAAGILNADHVMRQIYLLQDSETDDSFPGSTDNWFGGTVVPWNTTMNGVPSTAWVYFAQDGDPLLDLYPVGDFNGDGKVGFQDFFILIDGFGKKIDEVGFNALFDLDRNSEIDLNNFFLLADHFGECKR